MLSNVHSQSELLCTVLYMQSPHLTHSCWSVIHPSLPLSREKDPTPHTNHNEALFSLGREHTYSSTQVFLSKVMNPLLVPPSHLTKARQEEAQKKKKLALQVDQFKSVIQHTFRLSCLIFKNIFNWLISGSSGRYSWMFLLGTAKTGCEGVYISVPVSVGMSFSSYRCPV